MDSYMIPLDYPLSVFRRLRAGTPSYGTNRKYGSHGGPPTDGISEVPERTPVELPVRRWLGCCLRDVNLRVVIITFC